MTIVLNAKGHAIDFDAAVPLMDAEICEGMNCEDYETEQEWLDEYAARHERQFGEQFAPFAGGAW